MSSAINTAPSFSCWLQTLFCSYDVTKFNLSASELLIPLQSLVQFLLVVYFSCSFEGIYNKISNTREISERKIEEIKKRLEHDDDINIDEYAETLTNAMQAGYARRVGIIRQTSIFMMICSILFLLSSGLGKMSCFMESISLIFAKNIKLYIWLNIFVISMIYYLTYSTRRKNLRQIQRIFNELERTGKDSKCIVLNDACMDDLSKRTREQISHMKVNKLGKISEWFDQYRNKCITNAINDAVKYLPMSLPKVCWLKIVAHFKK